MRRSWLAKSKRAATSAGAGRRCERLGEVVEALQRLVVCQRFSRVTKGFVRFRGCVVNIPILSRRLGQVHAFEHIVEDPDGS